MTFEFNIHSITPIEESGGGEVKNQNKTVTTNGVYTADSGYTGLGRVTVDVETTEPTLTDLTIAPSTTSQTITPLQNTDGYNTITVEAVTASIDSDIQAENIKKGVDILGVTGTLESTSPSGTITITQNGTSDVTNYASAEVNVSGGAETIRGHWVVPQSYLNLEEAVANDSDYNTITSGYSNSGSVGLLFDNAYDTLVLRSAITNLIGIKTSDGTIYSKSDVYDNYSVFTHTWDKTKDNTDGTRYIILYFNSNVAPSYQNTLMTQIAQNNTSTPTTRMTNNIKYSVFNINVGGYMANMKQDSFKFINNHYLEIDSNTGLIDLSFNRGCTYFPPADEFISSNYDYSSSPITFAFAQGFHNLPYGLDFGNFSSVNLGTIDATTLEAYIKLPQYNVTLGNSNVIIKPDCWQYIADNAPVVSGKTLTIGSQNITLAGGTSGTIISVLTSKGWTVN